jgi:outer membrane protein OmpA-like peptidoglycan-associated protein
MSLYKKIIFSWIIPCLFICNNHAQESPNLVKNPDFEQYDECPDKHTEEDLSSAFLPGWTRPSGTAPDYFNRCSPSTVRVPKNFAGESEPKSGDGYIGAILSGSETQYREYVQGELTEPMQSGKQYCVTFHYKLASYSKFAVDQLSLYFSEERVFDNSIKQDLPFNPQINNTSGLFLDNINAWEQMCRVHVAKGGEKYFIIGNFKSYQNTNYVVTDKNVSNLRDKEYAYYYFDDVAIKPLENCNECPCVVHDFEARFIDTSYTGGKDPVTGEVERIKNDGQIKVGIIGGTPPYQVTWNKNLRGRELNNLPAGTYTFEATDKYNCRATGTVTFKEPEITRDEFEEGLQTIEEGEAIVLENIFFEFNKSKLLPESFDELNKVADFVIQNNIELIEISGHTDNVGSDSYNQKLSEGRAKSVVEYLAMRGINNSKMKAVGYGETKPIDTNLSEEGQAKNRRVEFRLLKK